MRGRWTETIFENFFPLSLRAFEGLFNCKHGWSCSAFLPFPDDKFSVVRQECEEKFNF